MSGIWMRAANRSRLYLGSRGDGTVTNVATRTVLRELASMSVGAGVVYCRQDRISARTGLPVHTVKRVMARLRRDGWVVELRRAVGNRHGIKPRPGVYMLARLPDDSGALLPARGDLFPEWERFTRSPLYVKAVKRERKAWVAAHRERFWTDDMLPSPVDNGPYSNPYKVTANPLQGDSAVPLSKRSENYPEHRSPTVSGGHPEHWRTGRSTAALRVIPGEWVADADDEPPERDGPTVATADRLASGEWVPDAAGT